jgi:hypothetical protein
MYLTQTEVPQLNAYGVGMNTSINQMTKRLMLDLSYMVV